MTPWLSGSPPLSALNPFSRSRLLAPPSVHAPRSLSVFYGVVRNALLSLDLPLFHILLPRRPAGSFHFKFGHIFYQRALKVSLIFPEASFPEASRLPDSIASISLATRTKKMALRVAIEIEVETFTEDSAKVMGRVLVVRFAITKSSPRNRKLVCHSTEFKYEKKIL